MPRVLLQCFYKNSFFNTYTLWKQFSVIVQPSWCFWLMLTVFYWFACQIYWCFCLWLVIASSLGKRWSAHRVVGAHSGLQTRNHSHRLRRCPHHHLPDEKPHFLFRSWKKPQVRPSWWREWHNVTLKTTAVHHNLPDVHILREMPLPRCLKILVRMCDVSLIVRRCRLWLDGISSCLFSESTNAGSPLLHCRHATLIAVKLPFIFLLLCLPLDPQRNWACIIWISRRHVTFTRLDCCVHWVYGSCSMSPSAISEIPSAVSLFSAVPLK